MMVMTVFDYRLLNEALIMVFGGTVGRQSTPSYFQNRTDGYSPKVSLNSPLTS